MTATEQPSRESLEQSTINLAMKIAWAEYQVATCAENLRGFAQRELDKAQKAAQGNQVVQQLLPQAREAIKRRDERDKFVRESTAAGRFVRVAQTFSANTRVNDKDSLLTDELEKCAWVEFCKAYRNYNAHEALDAMISILTYIQSDLEQLKDFPPLPEKLVIPANEPLS